jgi:hypothetical protein
MKKKITRLSVMQTGKFLGILYTLLAVIMVPFFLITSLGNPKAMVTMLPMLLLYPIMGFLGGMLMAAFYNLTAKWIGGIEVTVESSEAI